MKLTKNEPVTETKIVEVVPASITIEFTLDEAEGLAAILGASTHIEASLATRTYKELSRLGYSGYSFRVVDSNNTPVSYKLVRN